MEVNGVDARVVAHAVVASMMQGECAADAVGANFWKWIAVEDYRKLLADAAGLSPQEFRQRLHDVHVYEARAIQAGVSEEWLEKKFSEERRRWSEGIEYEIPEAQCTCGMPSLNSDLHADECPYRKA